MKTLKRWLPFALLLVVAPVNEVQALTIRGDYGPISLAPVGSTPSANGASLLGQQLTLQPSDGTHPGIISLSAQTMGGGIKTFASEIIAGTSVEAAYGLHATSLLVPINGAHTLGTGTLANGTYWYRVAAYNAGGITDVSIETSFTISTGPAGVNVVWGAVAGSDGYKVYCRTTGAEQLCATVTGGSTTTWLDDGSVTPSGALPGYTYGALLLDAPTNGQLPFLMRFNGVTKCFLTINGGWSCYDYQADNGWFQAVGGNVTLHLQGNATNGASAVGVKISNGAALSTAGSVALRVYSDNESTGRFDVLGTGGIVITSTTLPTCGATGTPEGTEVTIAGSGVTPTKKCFCTYTPTGTVYAWQSFLGVGTDTTCP